MSSEEVSKAPASGHIRQMRPEEVDGRGPQVRVVDVREPAEWSDDLGHIAGAELVPLGTLADARGEWDRRQPLLFVCRSGRRSMVAARQFVELGFEQVMNLEGGMLAYRARRNERP